MEEDMQKEAKELLAKFEEVAKGHAADPIILASIALSQAAFKHISEEFFAWIGLACIMAMRNWQPNEVLEGLLKYISEVNNNITSFSHVSGGDPN